jgi:hypothetical protein
MRLTPFFLERMRVFRVKSDVNNYRWLVPDVPDSDLLTHTTFDCTERFETWEPQRISFLDAAASQGDFAYYAPGALVSTPTSNRRINEFFEKAGEVLPLWSDGEVYSLLNVTLCVDALNNNETQWFEVDGRKISIRKHCFQSDCLLNLRSSLFKIPETSTGSVLALEFDGNPEVEFKDFCGRSGIDWPPLRRIVEFGPLADDAYRPNR